MSCITQASPLSWQVDADMTKSKRLNTMMMCCTAQQSPQSLRTLMNSRDPFRVLGLAPRADRSWYQLREKITGQHRSTGSRWYALTNLIWRRNVIRTRQCLSLTSLSLVAVQVGGGVESIRSGSKKHSWKFWSIIADVLIRTLYSTENV